MATGLDAQKNALKALETDLTATYPQQLEHLEQRMEAIFTAAEAAIKEYEQRATQLTNSFATAVQALHDGVAHAQQQADEHVTAAENTLAETKQHVDDATKAREQDYLAAVGMLNEIGTSYEKLETESKNAWQNVVQTAQPLVALVTQGTADVHSHGEALAQGLQQTGSSFEDDAKSMAQALHDFAQHAESEHQQHDAQHEQQAGSTQQHATQLISQNLDTLTHGVQTIAQALNVLAESGGSFGQHFGDGVKGLLGTVEEIGKVVDSIKPVLDVVKAIE